MKIIRCEHKDQCLGRKECMLAPTFFNEMKDVLSDQGLIVYPTDTLYAIGADPFDKKAVSKLYLAKKRPLDMPISIAVSNLKMMEEIAVLNDTAIRIYKNFLPGALTILLKKKGLNLFPDENVGIRIPAHPFFKRLIEITGPITSTSANVHGGNPTINVDTAVKQLGEKIDVYVDCGECRFKEASTIIDISKDKIKLIREGAIPFKTLQRMEKLFDE